MSPGAYKIRKDYERKEGSDMAKFDSGEPLGHFQKSATVTIRLHRTKWEGEDYLDLREWVLNEEGEIVPTKKGMRFRADLLPKLQDLLSRAEN